MACELRACIRGCAFSLYAAGLEFRVSGWRFTLYGLGFRVSGFRPMGLGMQLSEAMHHSRAEADDAKRLKLLGIRS